MQLKVSSLPRTTKNLSTEGKDYDIKTHRCNWSWDDKRCQRIPRLWVGYLSSELLARKVPDVPKIMQAIATAVYRLLELDSIAGDTML